MTSSAVARRQRYLSPALLVVLVLTAGALVATMAGTTGDESGGVADVVIALLVVVCNVMPVAAMAGLVVVTRRRKAAALPVSLGVLALTALVASLLVGLVRDSSSTAVLIYLFQPVYFWLLTGLTAALASASVWLADRRRARSQAPRAGDVVGGGSA